MLQAGQVQVAGQGQPQHPLLACWFFGARVPSLANSPPTRLETAFLLLVSAASTELPTLERALGAGAGLGSHQSTPLLRCTADSSTDGSRLAV
jgi:hypothetical protein